MNVGRRLSFLFTACLLGIALVLGWASTRPSISANAASALTAAGSYFDSTIVLARQSQPVGARGDELAIALGYLERLRAGVGSPFRLADDALHDPRLGVTMRPRVAWAILARLHRGDAYAIDPSVLDGAGPWTDGRGATGAAHLALIEHAIRSASDPRAGELAVRLAYLIESAKGSLSSSAVTVATQVAAQVRDRASAMTDAHDLLTDANAARAEVLDLLSRRRAQHAFRVEQPSLVPLSRELQIEAMNAAPALVAALDTLDRVPDPAPDQSVASAPVLGPEFATRLAALAAEQPPVPQVAVTLRSHPRARIVATNEESLVADLARASAPVDSLRRPHALALLAASVSIRTLAQQAPWFSGDGGPTTSDLVAEFGLAGVTFARTVPTAWRPFYLGQLQAGLRDVQRVLPSFGVTGLRVHFGTAMLPDSALAMHDPRTRTLQLSISTSGGTIAHELSHDLDFQTSRRLFADARGYSSDRSVRERGGALARSLRELAEARLLRPAPPGTAPIVDRPAELFARGSDWFIASTLARAGRTNGFLSAIEDEMLPGYAAGPPTAVGNSGAQSLTSALGAMTYLPDSLRVAYESQWSDWRAVDPVLIVRRALETPVARHVPWADQPVSTSALFAPSAELCAADPSDNARARERLLTLLVDARAEGMARRRATFHAYGNRPAWDRPVWANSVLGVAPWGPESGERVVAALRSAIVSAIGSAVGDQGVIPIVPSPFRPKDTTCSAL